MSTVEPEKEEKPDGLLKIIHDHQQRSSATILPEEKPTESVSYFRVAKSRFGKFETDNRGFVHSAAPIFVENQPETVSIAEEKNKSPTCSSSTTTTTKTTEILVRPVPITKTISNGKKAYDLLRKYEKEEQEELQTPLTIDTDYLKSENDEKKVLSEKLPTPIQVNQFAFEFSTFFFCLFSFLARSDRTNDAHFSKINKFFSFPFVFLLNQKIFVSFFR